MVGRSGRRATVIDVQTVGGRTRENQVMEFDIGWVGQMKAGTSTLEHRRLRWVGRSQNDGIVLSARQIFKIQPSFVIARGNPNLRTGFGIQNRSS
jgi:hypothetical protein